MRSARGAMNESNSRRPPVDPAETAAFGRPSGVTGGFDTINAPDSRPQDASGHGGHGSTESGTGAVGEAAGPPDSLVEAFSNPDAPDEVGLQRPADAPDEISVNIPESPLWGDENAPWRDPSADVTLGRPALDTTRDDAATTENARGAMLSLPEVLFGRRVKPTSLLILGVVALLIGACGGLVGWGATTLGNSLTGDLHVAEADSAKERAPGSVAKIASQVAPAVVSVEVGAGDGGGLGSGVVIDSQGYILTNHHVVAAADEDDDADITTVFTDGSRVPAKIVGSDPKTDLAVLKVEVDDPVVVEVGSMDELEPGDSVVAIGSPFGLSNTVTSGIVSAVNRPISAPGEQGSPPVTFDAIQTDAPINPGNSGGALVDSTGALVGINSLIRTSGDAEGQGGSIGLGFAIPIDQAIDVGKALIDDGEVEHPDLGVNAASVASYSSAGARIKNVTDDGPADKAGIREGDVVKKVADRQVRDAAELTVAVRGHDVGDVVPFTLVRDDRELTVDVKLASD